MTTENATTGIRTSAPQWMIDRHSACDVRVGDWPYDCESKRKRPNATVYICNTHGAWWWTETAS